MENEVEELQGTYPATRFKVFGLGERLEFLVSSVSLDPTCSAVEFGILENEKLDALKAISKNFVDRVVIKLYSREGAIIAALTLDGLSLLRGNVDLGYNFSSAWEHHVKYCYVKLTREFFV